MAEDRNPPAGRSGNTPGELDSTFNLLERARQGDADAIEQLFARHLKPLQRWATGRLPKWARDLADTDDLVQDTLLRTFKRMEGFESRGSGSLQAYLRRAVLNRLRDELRRKGRLPEMTDLDNVNDEGQSPIEETLGREVVAEYEDALARLDADEQEAIIGRIEMGYTYEELSRVLGKPSPDAARKAAQRALVRLAEEMKRVRQ